MSSIRGRSLGGPGVVGAIELRPCAPALVLLSLVLGAGCSGASNGSAPPDGGGDDGSGVGVGAPDASGAIDATAAADAGDAGEDASRDGGGGGDDASDAGGSDAPSADADAGDAGAPLDDASDRDAGEDAGARDAGEDANDRDAGEDAGGATGPTPTLALSAPAPVPGGTLWFGLSSESGAPGHPVCAPELTYVTSGIANGGEVRVWVVAEGAGCGAAPAGAPSGSVSGGRASVATASLSLVDGTTGEICAETANGAGSVQALPQSFACDLETPTVAWVSPAGGQTFVAYGQTQIAGATPSTSTDTLTLGLASAALTVRAPTGGTLVLSVDQVNTPGVTTTAFVTCSVPAASGSLSVYAVRSDTCTTSAATGQLLAPIDYGQLLAHTLTAQLTAPSGNAASPSLQSVDIDVAEPSAASVTASWSHAIGVGAVTASSIPGDDQSQGASPLAWEVRYATQPLTTSNWATGALVSANLAGSWPSGVPATFQVVLPSANPTLYVGVRARDRVGNLGDLAAVSSLVADTQPTGSAIALKDDSGSAPTSYFGQAMRVADLDGDGLDDIVLDYPSAHCAGTSDCDGRILVYFGMSGGLSNATAPLVLSGTIASGFLGAGQSFDVGDFDGDGNADIAAAETDFSTAHVLVWTSASIRSWRAAGTHAAAPAPVVLSDGSALVGGTVRAVGHITGGAGAGDDLLVSNYITGDGASGPYLAAVLARGGSVFTSGTVALFSAGSPAAAFLTLPSDVAGDSAASTDMSVLEAAPFTYPGAAGSANGLALSLVYVDTTTAPPATPQHEHALALFSGAMVAAGGTLGWASGAALGAPSGVAAHERFGLSLAGGHDAVGDTHADLLLADPDTQELFLYDGAGLLGASEPTAATVVYGATGETENVGYGAFLVPDLDGDGKFEIAGATTAAATTAPAYFWFGQTSGAAMPALPFFPASACASSPTTFCFAPARGQRIVGAPVLTGAPLGQSTGSGHVTSKTGRDLVILSQPLDASGASIAQGTLLLLR